MFKALVERQNGTAGTGHVLRLVVGPRAIKAGWLFSARPVAGGGDDSESGHDSRGGARVLRFPPLALVLLGLLGLVIASRAGSGRDVPV